MTWRLEIHPCAVKFKEPDIFSFSEILRDALTAVCRHPCVRASFSVWLRKQI